MTTCTSLPPLPLCMIEPEAVLANEPADEEACIEMRTSPYAWSASEYVVELSRADTDSGSSGIYASAVRFKPEPQNTNGIAIDEIALRRLHMELTSVADVTPLPYTELMCMDVDCRHIPAAAAALSFGDLVTQAKCINYLTAAAVKHADISPALPRLEAMLSSEFAIAALEAIKRARCVEKSAAAAYRILTGVLGHRSRRLADDVYERLLVDTEKLGTDSQCENLVAALKAGVNHPTDAVRACSRSILDYYSIEYATVDMR